MSDLSFETRTVERVLSDLTAAKRKRKVLLAERERLHAALDAKRSEYEAQQECVFQLRDELDKLTDEGVAIRPSTIVIESAACSESIDKLLGELASRDIRPV